MVVTSDSVGTGLGLFLERLVGMNIRLSIAIWVMLRRCLATRPPLSQAVESRLQVTFRTACTIDSSKADLDEIAYRLSSLHIGHIGSCRISESLVKLQFTARIITPLYVSL